MKGLVVWWILSVYVSPVHAWSLWCRVWHFVSGNVLELEIRHYHARFGCVAYSVSDQHSTSANLFHPVAKVCEINARAVIVGHPLLLDPFHRLCFVDALCVCSTERQKICLHPSLPSYHVIVSQVRVAAVDSKSLSIYNVNESFVVHLTCCLTYSTLRHQLMPLTRISLPIRSVRCHVAIAKPKSNKRARIWVTPI